MNTKRLTITVLLIILLGAVACEDDSYRPKCEKPPISVLKVEVVAFSIYAVLMYPPPDEVECQLTLRIENTSSKYSYSEISIPSGSVYRSSNNELLGEIRFETDWDGDIDAGEVETVVLTKIVENFQVFEYPCGEDVYAEITVTTPEHGDIKKRTTTYNFSCLI